MVRASLIWLNYNSSRFIDVALRSVESVLSLNFDDYEVVVVDNASTDGSFEAIRKFVEEKRPSNVRVRFVRSDVNKGYAGGMNLGWEARDKDAKYVAFLNNDLIVEPESLRGIIEHMEGDEKTAAASGLIHYGDGKTIYSAGGFVSEDWVFAGICMFATEDECPSLNKPHHVTYADGAYMVVKAEAVRSSCPEGKPFIDETHLYLDDALLGLTLWNKSYRVMYAPIKAGIHYANMTTKPLLSYYWVRAGTALIMLLNTRPWLRSIYLVRRRVGYRFLCSLGVTGYCDALRAFEDGRGLAKLIMDKLGYELSLYKAPYVKIRMSHTIVYNLLMLDRLLKRIGKPPFITHDDLTVPLLY